MALNSASQNGSLSAKMVRENFRKGHHRAGVVATVMWGFPEKMRGRVPMTLRQASVIGRVISVLGKGDPLPASAMMGALCSFEKLGPSTASKLLFMAEVESDEGPCLIYDEQVVRAISRLDNESEFEDLTDNAVRICRAKSPNARIHAFQKTSYAEYLIAAQAAAFRLGVTSLQIERFLFDKGGAD